MNEIHEIEYVGDFVLYLYHIGVILKDGTVSTRVLQRQFHRYLRENSKPISDCSEKALITLLARFEFARKPRPISDCFKFSFPKLFQYRNKIIEELDKKQTRNSIAKNLRHKISDDNILEKVKPEVDPDFEKELLIFNIRIKQLVKRDYTLACKGCYCCQLNFITEQDCINHIEYHTVTSDFEFLYENEDKRLPQQFEVSYRQCKSSHLLLFDIKNILADESNIIIEKIILIRSNSIEYLQEETYPLAFPSQGHEFYMDCHLFQLMYEQPFIIVYTLKGDKSFRYSEEHHFLRLDDFPPVKNILTNHVFQRNKLKCDEILLQYLPTPPIEALCRRFNKNSIELTSNFRAYIRQEVLLNSQNICDVFRGLLEMEDYTILSVYKTFIQDDVKVQAFGDDYFVELNYELLDGNISEFDIIILTPYTRNSKPIRGFITGISCSRVHFESDLFKSDDQLYCVTFEPQRLPIIYQHRALKFLESDENLRDRLFPENNIFNRTSNISLDWFHENVSRNPEQKETVQNIVDNRNKNVPFLIVGPPGTGKTTVIVESILQLWTKSKNNKILVTAGSNAACDEIAVRLCKIFKEIDPNGMSLLRIYSKSATKRDENFNPDVIEASNICYDEYFFPALETIYTYSIVIATLTICGRFVHGEIANNHFTHVFIDESAASTEILSIVGISRILSPSGHLILSGDPKQLGPIITCQRAANMGLRISMLERLMNRTCYEVDPETNQYNKSIQARLVRNYRNHKAILHLSNQLYYNFELIAEASAEISDWAIGWSRLYWNTFPIIFESVKGNTQQLDTKSLCNFDELHSVLSYVKDLMYFGVKGRRIEETDIGIISPYKKQCFLIRRELNRRGWFQIQTGSVETFQGKEKKIIIASMVRSKTNSVGFLNNPKRTNVLLTRAQALFIIIGNPDTLSKMNDWKSIIQYCTEYDAFRHADNPK